MERNIKLRTATLMTARQTDEIGTNVGMRHSFNLDFDWSIRYGLLKANQVFRSQGYVIWCEMFFESIETKSCQCAHRDNDKTLLPRHESNCSPWVQCRQKRGVWSRMLCASSRNYDHGHNLRVLPVFLRYVTYPKKLNEFFSSITRLSLS